MATWTAAAGGGNWNSNDTWEEGGGFPAAGDTANLDAGSGNVTINVASACAVLDCSGYTGTLAMDAGLTISGNLTLVAGMTFTPNAQKVTFTTTGTSTITTGGKVFQDIGFNVNHSSTGSYTLADDLTCDNLDLNYATGYPKLLGNTLRVTGDITSSATSGFWNGTTTALSIEGSGNQSIDLPHHTTYSQYGIDINIASTGGVVTFVAGTRIIAKKFQKSSGTVDFTTNSTEIDIRTGNAVNSNLMGATFYNLTFSCNHSGGGSTTLDGDVTVNNTLSVSSAGYPKLMGNNLYAKGDVSVAGTDRCIGWAGSTTVLNISGTGTQAVDLRSSATYYNDIPIVISNSGTVNFANQTHNLADNLTFNGTGTYNLAGTINYKTGTMTYTAGTVAAGTSTLNITAACTLNTDGIDWYNITYAAGTYTITLSSALTLTNTFTTGASGTITCNGFDINARGNITCGGSNLIGTTDLHIDGDGAQAITEGSNFLALDMNIDKGGNTLTINSFYYGVTGQTCTLTYTQGTVTCVGTFYVSGNVAFSADVGANITFKTLSGYGTGQVLTLNSDITCDTQLKGKGTFNGAFTIYTIDLYVQAAMDGTATIEMNGTGYLRSAGNQLSNNLIINTAGTVTVYASENFTYQTGTLTYTTGTVVTTNSTLSIAGSCTLNTNGINWYIIDFGANLTLTLTSNLTFTNNWNAANKNVTLSGNYALIAAGTSTMKAGTGLTMYNFTISPAATVHLTSAHTFTVSHTFDATGTLGNEITLDATTPDTQAVLIVTNGASVDYVNATDIDSSGGNAINDTAGVLDNATNWVYVALPSTEPITCICIIE